MVYLNFPGICNASLLSRHLYLLYMQNLNFQKCRLCIFDEPLHRVEHKFKPWLVITGWIIEARKFLELNKFLVEFRIFGFWRKPFRAKILFMSGIKYYEVMVSMLLVRATETYEKTEVGKTASLYYISTLAERNVKVDFYCSLRDCTLPFMAAEIPVIFHNFAWPWPSFEELSQIQFIAQMVDQTGDLSQ